MFEETAPKDCIVGGKERKRAGKLREGASYLFIPPKFITTKL